MSGSKYSFLSSLRIVLMVVMYPSPPPLTSRASGALLMSLVDIPQLSASKADGI